MFTSPPDTTGFNMSVWELVKQIPSGRVTTYGRIAGIIGVPDGVSEAAFKARGAQWVGGAMAACPDEVPWQRVINAQGKISERRGGSSLLQRELLEKEGVTFDDHDRIDLKKYGWPDDDEPDDGQLSLL
jgi:methylated-DNA-protein-cysteine methyltransferase related protein